MSEHPTAEQRAIAVRAADTDVTKPLGKFHVLGAAPMTACGRLGSVITQLAQEIPYANRCRRTGCRQRWPSYRAAGDKRIFK